MGKLFDAQPHYGYYRNEAELKINIFLDPRHALLHGTYDELLVHNRLLVELSLEILHL